MWQGVWCGGKYGGGGELVAEVSMDFCRLSADFPCVGRHNNFPLIRLSTSYKIAMSSEST